MAASSRPSIRSSRRVAGLHPSIDTTATGTIKNTKNPPKRRAKHSDAVQKTDGECPPNKKLKVEVQIEARSQPSSRNLKLAKDTTTLPTTKPPKNIATPPDSAESRTTNDDDDHSRRRTKKAQRKDVSRTNKVTATKSSEQMCPIDKRKLRSQDGGARFKSDLSLYFPGYEEIIGNEPKEPEFLSFDTPILAVDDGTPNNPRPHPSGHTKLTHSPEKKRGSTAHGQRDSSIEIGTLFPGKGIHYPKLYNAQVVDFSTLERAAKQSRDDPLPDLLYHKPHRRAERQEKQLRNIEKERAQHEKQHLERLLEGLMGPDWLKVMGVSGITESEKKEYEPKRDIFIREVAGLVEKFKAWKEEEKRRKAEKEQVLITEGDIEEQADEEDVGDISDGGDEEFNQIAMIDCMSDGDPPDYSDVDAWAARQLHQEAIGATSRSSSKRQKLEQPQTPKKQKAPPPQPFTSFYSKPYLRAAAIGNHRRSGRSVTAFGLPLPDVPQRDFEPPLDILNPEAVKARERNKRRLKRKSKDPKEHGVK
ncbi:hypothetical protein FGG08_004335 [Glutinoglossum americanum]|uniref:Something about silencing protein 4 domain-containing protein n=1 Tax=Glutinoglossum americanum TaxID=1670608 RepID=A0A9P8I5H5_9PEZI|nr:hypothetical protein FGG08_004335 [Glutinoglossum americanum]